MTRQDGNAGGGNGALAGTEWSDSGNYGAALLVGRVVLRTIVVVGWAVGKGNQRFTSVVGAAHPNALGTD